MSESENYTQMTIGDITGEKIILAKEVEEAEKKAKKIIEARNKAGFIIEDAKARYIKDKTRARSKKAAMEKDAILNSGRFDALNDYDRFDDIQEAYGYDCITEKERDRLEELWEERERIKNHVEGGMYSDLVTQALQIAWIAVQDFMDEDVEAFYCLEKDFKKQKQEAEIQAQEWLDKQNRVYDKLMRGD